MSRSRPGTDGRSRVGTRGRSTRRRGGPAPGAIHRHRLSVLAVAGAVLVALVGQTVAVGAGATAAALESVGPWSLGLSHAFDRVAAAAALAAAVSGAVAGVVAVLAVGMALVRVAAA